MVTNHTDDANLLICRALGIDTSTRDVVGVNIRLRANEIPTITVRRIIWQPASVDGDELATITTRYELIERTST